MESIGIWGATPGRGSGIGKAILERLIGDAGLVIHVFGRAKDKVTKLRDAFPAVKGSLVWDLRDERGVDAYQEYVKDCGIKTVVCAVGVGVGNPIPFLTQAELKEMVEANLASPFMILKNSLLPLKQLGGGRVIMFGSITSFRPEEGSSGYSATKAALRGLVESTRRELRSGFQSVSVHGIYAGSVGKVGMESVVDAAVYLSRLRCGVHADVIVN